MSYPAGACVTAHQDRGRLEQAEAQEQGDAEPQGLKKKDLMCQLSCDRFELRLRRKRRPFKRWRLKDSC